MVLIMKMVVVSNQKMFKCHRLLYICVCMPFKHFLSIEVTRTRKPSFNSFSPAADHSSGWSLSLPSSPSRPWISSLLLHKNQVMVLMVIEVRGRNDGIEMLTGNLCSSDTILMFFPCQPLVPYHEHTQSLQVFLIHRMVSKREDESFEWMEHLWKIISSITNCSNSSDFHTLTSHRSNHIVIMILIIPEKNKNLFFPNSNLNISGYVNVTIRSPLLFYL